jgi:heavy metal sensor kinase
MTFPRNRLLDGLLILLAMVLMLFSTVTYLLVRESIEADVDQFVLDKALILGREVNPANPAWIRFEERDWHSFRFTPIGQTFDAEWRPLFVSSRLLEPILPTEQVKRAATHPLGFAHHDAAGPDGERYRMATVTVNHEGELLCYAQIGVLWSEHRRPLHRLMLWLAGGSVAAWFGAWLAAGHLIKQSRAPLELLGEAARRVSVRNLSRQRLFAPPDAPELAHVAQAFNDLLDKLQAAHSTQQRFVGDASHELRTPLTILRGEIEVALRRDRSPAEYREVLQSSLDEIERLSRLVENLLALARVDAGETMAGLEEVDVADLARHVRAKLAPMAGERKIPLRCDAADSARVSGDPILLERVLFNLVENALRYTPPGEPVALRVRQSGPYVQVEVEDRGHGIPPDHLPHVFDRFYRIDKVRSREFGGAGLGLAIVKSFVEAHGGRVEARSELGKGSTFTVWLPRSAPELGVE